MIKEHNVDIEARNIRKSIVDYESFKLFEFPIESFIMQTVFETETTLQHPYEF